MGISAQKTNKFILFVFKHWRELGLVLHQFCFRDSINFLKIRKKKYGGIWELQNYVPRGAEHQDCVHFPRNMTQCGCLDNAWTFFRKVVSIHWTAVSTHTHTPPPPLPPRGKNFLGYIFTKLHRVRFAEHHGLKN
jgi:hypothetical protein